MMYAAAIILSLFAALQGLAWFGAHSGSSRPDFRSRLGVSLSTGGLCAALLVMTLGLSVVVTLILVAASIVVAGFGFWVHWR